MPSLRGKLLAPFFASVGYGYGIGRNALRAMGNKRGPLALTFLILPA